MIVRDSFLNENPLAAIVSGRCYYDPKATFAASKGARIAPINS